MYKFGFFFFLIVSTNLLAMKRVADDEIHTNTKRLKIDENADSIASIVVDIVKRNKCSYLCYNDAELILHIKPSEISKTFDSLVEASLTDKYAEDVSLEPRGEFYELRLDCDMPSEKALEILDALKATGPNNRLETLIHDSDWSPEFSLRLASYASDPDFPVKQIFAYQNDAYPSYKTIETWGTALKLNKNCTEICIYDRSEGIEEVFISSLAYLFDGLKSNTSLKKLFLYFSHIDGSEFYENEESAMKVLTMIANAMKHNRTLEYLAVQYVANNGIQDFFDGDNYFYFYDVQSSYVDYDRRVETLYDERVLPFKSDEFYSTMNKVDMKLKSNEAYSKYSAFRLIIAANIFDLDSLPSLLPRELVEEIVKHIFSSLME